MYFENPDIYDQTYSFKDYLREANDLVALIDQWNPNASTLLDVACGTGLHLERLSRHFQCEGLDINHDFLAKASGRFGGKLHHGDMESFSLQRLYDVVICLFGSISYLQTPDRLARAITCMAQHVAPGGLLVIEPWLTPENFWHGNVKLEVSEQRDRKIASMYVAKEENGVAILERHFLIGEPTGVRHFVEVHREGLFRGSDIIDPIQSNGFEIVHDDPFGLHGWGLFVARRPSGSSEK